MSELAIKRQQGSAPIMWGATALAAGAVLGWLVDVVAGSPELTRAVVLAAAALVALGVVVAVLWRPWLGALAILAVLPLETAGRIIEQPVTLTLFHLTLLLSLGAWGVHVLLGRQKVRFSLLDVGLGLLVVAAVWSYPRSLNPGATMMATVRLAFLWLFAIFIVNQLTSRARIRAASWVMLVTASVMGVVAVAQIYVPGFNFGNVHEQGPKTDRLVRAAAFFDDPNYLAGFLSCAVLVSAVMIVRSKRWRDTLLPAAFGAVSALGVIVTYSRTAWVGILVGLVVVALSAPPARRTLIIAAGIAGVVAIAAVGIGPITARLASSADVSGDASVGTRVLMLESNVQMIRDDWVYGAGLGAFDRRYLQYRQTGSLPDIIRPHQVPLALWAETGVFGLLAQIVIVSAILIAFVRRRPDGWTEAEAIACAGLASLSVQALFQYYVYFEYVWLFLALAVVTNRVAKAAGEVL